MITKNQIVEILLNIFPTFVPDEDDIDLPYIVLGDFARFLLEAFQRKDESLLKKAAIFIERLHLEGDGYVKEAATIGLLEGIQNTWQGSGVEPEKFVPYLLPESKRWWDSLNRFWEKEIPHVGADIKHH
ncbi:MAG: hypothetical protein GY928_28010 [Colwellia sp.]|nr:hypothetical protein [Colwellia sp.]